MIRMHRRFQCGLLLIVLLAGGSAPAQKKPQKNSQPESVFEPFKAEKSVEIGMFYLKKKNYDAAIDRFQDALRYKPGFARPHLLLGKAFEAVSADRDAGELMGVSATRTVMLSYGLSGLVAAVAGILVSPITTVGPTMASAMILKAFSVAVVAGLESGFGVVVVGLFLGALESLASFYVGSGWREAPGLLLLILALAVRPTGLFGKAVIRKV